MYCTFMQAQNNHTQGFVTLQTLKKLLSKAKTVKFLILILIILNYVKVILLKQQQKDVVLSHIHSATTRFMFGFIISQTIILN